MTAAGGQLPSATPPLHGDWVVLPVLEPGLGLPLGVPPEATFSPPGDDMTLGPDLTA